MNMLKVKQINEVYTLKAEDENYEDENTVNIVVVSSELMELSELIGAETKTLLFGELRKRFQYGKKELERLLKN